MGWWTRFFFEYIGNVDAQREKRREMMAREDLAQRGVGPAERDRIVEELRESVREGETEGAR